MSKHAASVKLIEWQFFLIVKFHILIASSVKVAEFCDVASCSLLNTDRPDYGGSTFLWNFGQYLPDNNTQENHLRYI